LAKCRDFFSIYIVLVLAALTGMARFFKTKIPKSAAALTGPLLFFSSMTFCVVWGFVSLFELCGVDLLLGLMLYLVFEPRLTNYKPLDYLKPIFQLPIQLAVRCKETLLELSGVKQIAQAPGNAAGYRWRAHSHYRSSRCLLRCSRPPTLCSGSMCRIFSRSI